MRVHEIEFDLPAIAQSDDMISCITAAVELRIADDEAPVRFVVSSSDENHFHCELAVLSGARNHANSGKESIFRFFQRKSENTDQFNVAVIVPTGIGAEIGGHAGDATPVVKLFSAICDRVITHPNVVNASDINELPENALYVEGSVLSRLLMGTVGLQPVRSNRVLTVIDAHRDPTFLNAAINSVSAARAAYGLRCPGVIMLDPPVILKTEYSGSGRARGEVDQLDGLFSAIAERQGEFDAVAVSSVIRVPHSFHLDYFLAEGRMVNPWGGVEAMLTHSLSHFLDVPTAHAPMFESQEIANMDPGIVEPRMAAEAVSLTFIQCILKGLSRSPRIIMDRVGMRESGVLTASDVSCLVVPDGCIGLPTLAALQQGIPVIAVKENRNVMKNDLGRLPWQNEQLLYAENYWEAVGLAASLKAGISPTSVRRPMSYTATHMVRFDRPQTSAIAEISKTTHSEVG